MHHTAKNLGLVIALFVLLAVPGAARAADIQSDLVIHYSFDDANNLGLDSSGNGYTGVLGGTIAPIAAASSIKGGAAFFNRNGWSRIDVPAAAQLGTSYTKSVWAFVNKPAGGGGGFITHPTKYTLQHAFMQYGSNSILSANAFSASGLKINRAITLGSWSHYVTTYDAPTQTLKLYVNGQLTDTLTGVAVVPVADRALMVGSAATPNTTRTFDGPLDEVRVYVRALSADDVLELYNFDRTTIAAPQSLLASETQGTVSLTFGAVSGAEDYRIEYKLSSGSSYTVFTDSVTTTTGATIPGLTAGETYQFRVAAVQNSVTGPYSSVAELTLATPSQEAPTAGAVAIAGMAQAGQTLTGSYTYADTENDPESGTTVRWLTGASTTGPFTALPGATTPTYAVAQGDVGAYLAFEVTPRAGTGTQEGTPVRSTAVLVTAAPPEPPADEDIQTGLVLHYAFDDANNLGLDSSSNGYTGVLTGTTIPTAATSAIKGGAAFFNRVGFSRIVAPAGAQLGASYTKSVWAYVSKAAGGGGGFIAHPTKVSLPHTFMQSGSASIIAANAYSVANPKITEPALQHAWAHYVTTYDSVARTLSLYVNGTLVQTLSNVDPVPAADRALMVGAMATNSTTRTFDGPLDEVRVYARALTPSEVTHLYNIDRTDVAAPANVSPQPLTGRVRVGYAPVAGATDYELQYKESAQSSYTSYNDGIQAVSFIEVPGLTNGTSYDFRVRALKNGVRSAYSSAVSATPGPQPQAAPTAYDARITGTPTEGQVVTGQYAYFDVNDDAEGASTYRWLKSATLGGTYTPIAGATAATYTPTQSDGNRYLVFEVTPRAVSGTQTGMAYQSAPVQAQALSRFYHVLATGQSLSVGGGPMSVTQPYQNLMLSSMRDAEGNAHDVAPFIPLKAISSEKIDIPASNTYAGFMHEGGTDVVIVSTAHGVGGQAYDYIKKGTAPYTRGIGQAQLTKELATAAGGQYIPLALTLVHGEYDSLYNNTNYDQNIEQLREDYEADVSAIAGTPVTLPMFYSQTSQQSPHRAALLQLKAHRQNEHDYLTGPIYQYEYNNPGYLHLTGAGSRDLGEQVGKVMYEVLALGHDWHPLMPTQITRTGTSVFVKYHVPVGPIVFDTTQVAERANKGFMYWVNGVQASIAGVEIVSADTIKITLAAQPAAGATEEVSYAINPAYGTKHYGDALDPLAYGGNVRDSDTRVAPGSTSSGKPLYNWAVAFRDPVTLAP